MLVRYVHHSNPETEKICDTQKTFRGCSGFLYGVGAKKTQEEWDKEELERFERDLKRGHILSYSVVGGENA